jgi:RNA polymerase sigma-70 factor (ECF subfamily)
MAIDEATLARLLVREHDKLAAYAWSLVRDDHLVDDILQELALIAIRKREEIVDEQHFLAWMRVTCRRTALDTYKRRKHRPHPLGDAVLDLLDAEWTERDAVASPDLSEALRSCLEQLTPYARRLVQMRYGEGLKTSQVARSLGRNVETIYVALTRVHRALGDCIRGQLAKETLHG